jgi:hypothetical protein
MELESSMQLEDCNSASVLEGSWFKSNAQNSQTAADVSSLLNRKRLYREGDSSEDIEIQTSNQKQQAKKPKTSSSGRDFPTNNTLSTSGKDITILIKQIDQNKNFTNDPVGIAKGFKDLKLSTIKDVRLNKRRNLIAVDFMDPNNNEMQKLLAIEVLGKYKIKCYKPSIESNIYKSGVIGPIDLDVNLDEMKAMTDSTPKVLNMMRLPKFSNGKKEESLMIKVDFEGKVLPQKLCLGFLSYPVKMYNPPPIRCYNCQRMGHMANGCTAKTKCLVCGGDHRKEQCEATSPNCANCGGPHIASFRDCSFVKNMYNIQNTMQQERLSFNDARKKIISQQAAPDHNDFLTQGTQQSRSTTLSQFSPSDIDTSTQASQSSLQTFTHVAEVHQSQGSYYLQRRFNPKYAQSFAEALKSNNTNTEQAENIQRDKTEEIIASCSKYIDRVINDMYLKLINFLKEAFSLKLDEEQKRERELVLISMARNHFGSTIGETLLHNMQSEKDLTESEKAPTATSSGNLVSGSAVGPGTTKTIKNNALSTSRQIPKLSQIQKENKTKNIAMNHSKSENSKQGTNNSKQFHKNARLPVKK